MDVTQMEGGGVKKGGGNSSSNLTTMEASLRSSYADIAFGRSSPCPPTSGTLPSEEAQTFVRLENPLSNVPTGSKTEIEGQAKVFVEGRESGTQQDLQQYHHHQQQQVVSPPESPSRPIRQSKESHKSTSQTHAGMQQLQQGFGSEEKIRPSRKKRRPYEGSKSARGLGRETFQQQHQHLPSKQERPASASPSRQRRSKEQSASSFISASDVGNITTDDTFTPVPRPNSAVPTGSLGIMDDGSIQIQSQANKLESSRSHSSSLWSNDGRCPSYAEVFFGGQQSNSRSLDSLNNVEQMPEDNVPVQLVSEVSADLLKQQVAEIVTFVEEARADDDRRVVASQEIPEREELPILVPVSHQHVHELECQCSSLCTQHISPEMLQLTGGLEQSEISQPAPEHPVVVPMEIETESIPSQLQMHFDTIIQDLNQEMQNVYEEVVEKYQPPENIQEVASQQQRDEQSIPLAYSHASEDIRANPGNKLSYASILAVNMPEKPVEAETVRKSSPPVVYETISEPLVLATSHSEPMDAQDTEADARESALESEIAFKHPTIPGLIFKKEVSLLTPSPPRRRRKRSGRSRSKSLHTSEADDSEGEEEMSKQEEKSEGEQIQKPTRPSRKRKPKAKQQTQSPITPISASEQSFSENLLQVTPTEPPLDIEIPDELAYDDVSEYSQSQSHRNEASADIGYVSAHAEDYSSRARSETPSEITREGFADTETDAPPISESSTNKAVHKKKKKPKKPKQSQEDEIERALRDIEAMEKRKGMHKGISLETAPSFDESEISAKVDISEAKESPKPERRQRKGKKQIQVEQIEEPDNKLQKDLSTQSVVVEHVDVLSEALLETYEKLDNSKEPTCTCLKSELVTTEEIPHVDTEESAPVATKRNKKKQKKGKESTDEPVSSFIQPEESTVAIEHQQSVLATLESSSPVSTVLAAQDVVISPPAGEVDLEIGYQLSKSERLDEFPLTVISPEPRLESPSKEISTNIVKDTQEKIEAVPATGNEILITPAESVGAPVPITSESHQEPQQKPPKRKKRKSKKSESESIDEPAQLPAIISASSEVVETVAEESNTKPSNETAEIALPQPEPQPCIAASATPEQTKSFGLLKSDDLIDAWMDDDICPIEDDFEEQVETTAVALADVSQEKPTIKSVPVAQEVEQPPQVVPVQEEAQSVSKPTFGLLKASDFDDFWMNDEPCPMSDDENEPNPMTEQMKLFAPDSVSVESKQEAPILQPEQKPAASEPVMEVKRVEEKEFKLLKSDPTDDFWMDDEPCPILDEDEEPQPPAVVEAKQVEEKVVKETVVATTTQVDDKGFKLLKPDPFDDMWMNDEPCPIMDDEEEAKPADPVLEAATVTYKKINNTSQPKTSTSQAETKSADSWEKEQIKVPKRKGKKGKEVSMKEEQKPEEKIESPKPTKRKPKRKSQKSESESESVSVSESIPIESSIPQMQVETMQTETVEFIMPPDDKIEEQAQIIVQQEVEPRLVEEERKVEITAAAVTKPLVEEQPQIEHSSTEVHAQFDIEEKPVRPIKRRDVKKKMKRPAFVTELSQDSCSATEEVVGAAAQTEIIELSVPPAADIKSIDQTNVADSTELVELRKGEQEAITRIDDIVISTEQLQLQQIQKMGQDERGAPLQESLATPLAPSMEASEAVSIEQASTEVATKEAEPTTTKKEITEKNKRSKGKKSKGKATEPSDLPPLVRDSGAATILLMDTATDSSIDSAEIEISKSSEIEQKEAPEIATTEIAQLSLQEPHVEHVKEHGKKEVVASQKSRSQRRRTKSKNSESEDQVASFSENKNVADIQEKQLLSHQISTSSSDKEQVVETVKAKSKQVRKKTKSRSSESEDINQSSPLGQTTTITERKEEIKTEEVTLKDAVEADAQAQSSQVVVSIASTSVQEEQLSKDEPKLELTSQPAKNKSKQRRRRTKSKTSESEDQSVSESTQPIEPALTKTESLTGGADVKESKEILAPAVVEEQLSKNKTEPELAAQSLKNRSKQRRRRTKSKNSESEDHSVSESTQQSEVAPAQTESLTGGADVQESKEIPAPVVEEEQLSKGEPESEHVVQPVKNRSKQRRRRTKSKNSESEDHSVSETIQQSEEAPAQPESLTVVADVKEPKGIPAPSVVKEQLNKDKTEPEHATQPLKNRSKQRRRRTKSKNSESEDQSVSESAQPSEAALTQSESLTVAVEIQESQVVLPIPAPAVEKKQPSKDKPEPEFAAQPAKNKSKQRRRRTKSKNSESEDQSVSESMQSTEVALAQSELLTGAVEVQKESQVLAPTPEVKAEQPSKDTSELESASEPVKNKSKQRRRRTKSKNSESEDQTVSQSTQPTETALPQTESQTVEETPTVEQSVTSSESQVEQESDKKTEIFASQPADKLKQKRKRNKSRISESEDTSVSLPPTIQEDPVKVSQVESSPKIAESEDKSLPVAEIPPLPEVQATEESENVDARKGKAKQRRKRTKSKTSESEEVFQDVIAQTAEEVSTISVSTQEIATEPTKSQDDTATVESQSPKQTITPTLISLGEIEPKEKQVQEQGKQQSSKSKQKLRQWKSESLDEPSKKGMESQSSKLDDATALKRKQQQQKPKPKQKLKASSRSHSESETTHLSQTDSGLDINVQKEQGQKTGTGEIKLSQEETLPVEMESKQEEVKAQEKVAEVSIPAQAVTLKLKTDDVFGDAWMDDDVCPLDDEDDEKNEKSQEIITVDPIVPSPESQESVPQETVPEPIVQKEEPSSQSITEQLKEPISVPTPSFGLKTDDLFGDAWMDDDMVIDVSDVDEEKSPESTTVTSEQPSEVAITKDEPPPPAPVAPIVTEETYVETVTETEKSQDSLVKPTKATEEKRVRFPDEQLRDDENKVSKEGKAKKKRKKPTKSKAAEEVLSRTRLDSQSSVDEASAASFDESEGRESQTDPESGDDGFKVFKSRKARLKNKRNERQIDDDLDPDSQGADDETTGEAVDDVTLSEGKTEAATDEPVSLNPTTGAVGQEDAVIAAAEVPAKGELSFDPDDPLSQSELVDESWMTISDYTEPTLTHADQDMETLLADEVDSLQQSEETGDDVIPEVKRHMSESSVSFASDVTIISYPHDEEESSTVTFTSLREFHTKTLPDAGKDVKAPPPLPPLEETLSFDETPSQPLNSAQAEASPETAKETKSQSIQPSTLQSMSSQLVSQLEYQEAESRWATYVSQKKQHKEVTSQEIGGHEKTITKPLQNVTEAIEMEAVTKTTKTVSAETTREISTAETVVSVSAPPPQLKPLSYAQVAAVPPAATPKTNLTENLEALLETARMTQYLAFQEAERTYHEFLTQKRLPENKYEQTEKSNVQIVSESQHDIPKEKDGETSKRSPLVEAAHEVSKMVEQLASEIKALSTEQQQAPPPQLPSEKPVEQKKFAPTVLPLSPSPKTTKENTASSEPTSPQLHDSQQDPLLLQMVAFKEAERQWREGLDKQKQKDEEGNEIPTEPRPDGGGGQDGDPGSSNQGPPDGDTDGGGSGRGRRKPPVTELLLGGLSNLSCNWLDWSTYLSPEISLPQKLTFPTSTPSSSAEGAPPQFPSPHPTTESSRNDVEGLDGGAEIETLPTEIKEHTADDGDLKKIKETTKADVDELGKAISAAADKLSNLDPEQLEQTLHKTWELLGGLKDLEGSGLSIKDTLGQFPSEDPDASTLSSELKELLSKLVVLMAQTEKLNKAAKVTNSEARASASSPSHPSTYDENGRRSPEGSAAASTTVVKGPTGNILEVGGSQNPKWSSFGNAGAHSDMEQMKSSMGNQQGKLLAHQCGCCGAPILISIMCPGGGAHSAHFPSTSINTQHHLQNVGDAPAQNTTTTTTTTTTTLLRENFYRAPTTHHTKESVFR
ncbi:unnamed protein product [Orchesella dallaii]|uniref:Titin n=1 Tax=Orchesella dallaii TaxID=48710 RepID=A0ABP1QEB8_9HEXA